MVIKDRLIARISAELGITLGLAEDALDVALSELQFVELGALFDDSEWNNGVTLEIGNAVQLTLQRIKDRTDDRSTRETNADGSDGKHVAVAGGEGPSSRANAGTGRLHHGWLIQDVGSGR